MRESKNNVLACLRERPDDLLSWVALADLLEAEGGDDSVAALDLARNAGIWLGTRLGWALDGPTLVRCGYTVRRLVLTDMAPRAVDSQGGPVFEWRVGTYDLVSTAAVPYDWIPPSKLPAHSLFFTTVEKAWEWLQERALEWASRAAHREDFSWSQPF